MTINKICEQCGKLFTAQLKHHNAGAAKFCSRRCSNERKKKKWPEKPCPKCGILFTSKKKFCTKKCADAFQTPRNVKNDIIGNRYGKLTVLKYINSKSRNNNYHKLLRVYLCVCDCGKQCERYGVDLRAGSTQSCGCFKTETQIKIHAGRVSPQRNPNGAQQQTAKEIWKRTYSNGISFEDFFRISQLNCYYCGTPPSNRGNTISPKYCSKEWYDQGWWIYNGLDRLDSSKDHSIENVVPACWRCNKAKGIMQEKEFYIWIIDVYNHRQLKKTSISLHEKET